jgi:hemolysin III
VAVQAPARHREQTAREEWANCASHGLAVVLSAVGLPWLVQSSSERHGTSEHAVAVIVFSITMILLYLASALYHGLPPGRSKRLFARVDHASIYLFIAGSYMPFAASGLHGPAAWLLLASTWTLALTGSIATSFDLIPHGGWSTGLYVAMGWLVLLAAIPWLAGASSAGLWLLIAGGLAYTVGAGLYLLGGRLRYGHLGWHLLVMTGSALHFVAALRHS